LSSNSGNRDGVREARKILAVALKEASLVPDVYVSTVSFEIEHGNNAAHQGCILSIINVIVICIPSPLIISCNLCPRTSMVLFPWYLYHALSSFTKPLQLCQLCLLGSKSQKFTKCAQNTFCMVSSCDIVTL